MPDGGATVALLGLAMGGMVWVRRKLASPLLPNLPENGKGAGLRLRLFQQS